MKNATLHQLQQLGDPMDRIDGRVKVTGAARYAAEYNLPDMAYGVLVTSTIAKGRIRSFDNKTAEAAPGVLAVITHLNSPKVPGFVEPAKKEEGRVYGEEFRLFNDDRILHNHQPIALVVADTLERANYAAMLVKAQYDKAQHTTELEKNTSKGIKPVREKDYTRGKTNAYESASVHLELHFKTPLQVHNPMETHSTTAVWEGEDKVTVYNKTQAVTISQQEIMRIFKLKKENVRAHSPYVGGAFGSSSRVWPQEMAALIGAKMVKRPVKVMARREQVFNMVGYRPESIQKFGLGATADGQLVGITHKAFGSTSTYEQFPERIMDPTKTLYSCPNLNTVYRLVELDMSTPCWTRAPGEASGSFALESAMDELAYKLNMDPMALRLKNFAGQDPEKNLPWSSNYLKQCYEMGAERFNWIARNPEPRSMRAGDLLVGMGMSAGIYKSERSKAAASATARADGKVLVQTSVADVGPGSATIMAQIAAEALGMETSQILFDWGDSSYPPAPGQFGSHTTASTGTAVYEVCRALRQKLQDLAVNQQNSPLFQANADALVFENGSIGLRNGSGGLSYGEILKSQNLPELKVTLETKGGEEHQKKYSGKSFCANFVEVHVHPLTGTVKVSRVVCVVDAGRIMNQKTARSQVYGSVIWGIGLALMEEGIVDHRYGRYVNNDLADYHLPVNADVPAIDVQFINEADTKIDPMGAKGLGEIGMVGFAAAIANAVYHATGKRIRELPITPTKLV